MATKLLQQYIYERDTWGRLLDYLQEENILYKNRIAIIIKNENDSLLIENIELFLNKFVLEDAIILIFRHDLAYANIINGSKGSDLKNRGSFEDISDTQKKLRGEIEIIENQFNRLKFEFNKYLAEKLSNNK